MEKTFKYGWGLPPDISTHGPQIDNIINLLHWFMLVLFVGWGIFMLLALIKFRARPGHTANYHGVKTHVSTYLEGAVAVVEVFFLVFLSIPVWAEIKASPPPPDKADINVRVVGEQFAWNIHYPGPDGKFGKTDVSLVGAENPLGLDRKDPAAKDDITTINQLHFPVNKKVLVNLTSKDVIHSFALPVMRVKQDAIPGMTVPVWFEANQTGQFEIGCAQLCGLGHYRMKGFFSVDTDEQYAAWLKEQSEAANMEKSYY
jgi:cytochrome c oxidase subunit 2